MTAPGASSDARAWLAEADRLQHGEQFALAAAHYHEALARDGSLFDAWYGLAFAQSALREHGNAIDAWRRALTLRPDASRLRVKLAEALFVLGHVSDSVREYERAIVAGDKAAREMALRNIACISPGDPAMDNEAVMRARRRWAEAEAVSITPGRPSWQPNPKPRIGYVSSLIRRVRNLRSASEIASSTARS